MHKRIISFIIILILCINVKSFSAVVSDNDGASFISKAEFDSLKNNFQSQIDQYNVSIDSKIDGAIAAYLAGIVIATDMEQNSLLNNISPKFEKGKTFGYSYLGTYCSLFISLAYACHGGWHVDGSPTGQTQADIIYTFEGTAPTWYNPDIVEKNADDIEKLYNISRVKVNGIDCYRINFLQQSKYFVSLAGGAAGGRGWARKSNKTYYELKEQTIEKTSTLKYFGAINVAIPIVKGEHCTDTGASASFEENALATWAFTDTQLTDNTLESLCGEVMNSTDDVNCIIDDEINEIGDVYYTSEKTANTGGARRWTGTKGNVVNYSNASYTPKINIKAYRHKITKLKQTDFISYGMSNVYGEPVKFYEGCPMFKSNATGTCSISLKFVNDSSANTTFEIKNGRFTNQTVNSAGGATGIESCDNSTWTVGSNQTIDFKFKAVDGETYWIKALPASGKTTITTDQIIIRVD